MKYAFIKQHAGDYSIRRLCLTLKIHPSGYYAWLSEPQSVRAKDDQRLLGLIKHSWLESGGVYGYRKIHDDLREIGEDCSRHRVARLMRLEGLRSQTGYRIVARVLLDKGVLQPHSLAKYAAAFFNMSRSSVTRFSSARRRRSSAC